MTVQPRTIDLSDRLIRESRARTEGHLPDRASARPVVRWPEAEARRRARAHPLLRHVPFLRGLLEPVARSHGLVFAVADAQARLLSVEGDERIRRLAGSLDLRVGAEWSERVVGTNGFGTAIASGHPVHVSGAEHYWPLAGALQCWAVPVRDPATGRLLGVLDLSGPVRGSSGYELALLEAAASAVEARLASCPAAGEQRPRIEVLGRSRALVSTAGRAAELSARHSEIVTLLAWFPPGLSAEGLAERLYERQGDAATVRAEMRRLRTVLDDLDPGLATVARPYAFVEQPILDAAEVADQVRRGAHRRAAAAYRGHVLPSSTAPGIAAIRCEVATGLRAAVLSNASAPVLLGYARRPENHHDEQLWLECLRVLPPRSPHRAEVVRRLERLRGELAT